MCLFGLVPTQFGKWYYRRPSFRSASSDPLDEPYFSWSGVGYRVYWKSSSPPLVDYISLVIVDTTFTEYCDRVSVQESVVPFDIYLRVSIGSYRLILISFRFNLSELVSKLTFTTYNEYGSLALRDKSYECYHPGELH